LKHSTWFLDGAKETDWKVKRRVLLKLTFQVVQVEDAGSNNNFGAKTLSPTTKARENRSDLTPVNG